MKKNVKQVLENLPQEILSQHRFFPVNADKVPLVKDWSNPDNQKLHTEIDGLAGFDTAGHGVAPDYLFLDFDHCLDANGNFVTPLAEQWFSLINAALKSYCELSASKTGAHIIALPTVGKFKKISSGKNGRIYFSERRDKDAPYLEVFYGTGGRYCFFTGDVWHCEPKAEITHGQAVDDVFQLILDEIVKNNTKPNSEPCAEKQKKSEPSATLIYQSNGNSREYDTWRACRMLEVIPVALLSREDWINVGMALKNNGNDCAEWELWSRPDERFKTGECEKLWQGFNGSGLTIATICDIAEHYGYNAKSVYDEWCNLHPEFKSQIIRRTEPISDNEAKDDFKWTQDLIKSCPANLRLPPDYIFSASGITQIVECKTKTKYIPVTKTAIVPTKIFFEPIKGIDEYEIAILSRAKWRRVEVPATTLGDAKALNMLCSSGALILDNARLKVFLAELIALNPDMPEIKTYSQTGWTSDECEEFAFPSTNGNLVVRREGYDYERIFKPKGNPELWKQKFVEVTEQGGAKAHVIIGGACAALLIKPLEDLPNLQIHVWGKKSIGKTPMLKFAVSPFGNPDVDCLTQTFDATPKSRLETACALNDLPHICEELESVGAKDAHSLSRDVYNYFLGIGGQALKRNGNKRKSKLFNGVRLSSGEHSLVHSCGNGGEFKRVLDLRCSSLLEENFASDLYGFCKRNHGLFGEQWIQYIIKNSALISKHYNQILETVKNEQKRNADETDLTQLRTLVISTVAYQHFKICIGLQAEMNFKELGNDLDEIVRILPLASEIDDTARAVEALKDFVAGHDKYFTHETKEVTLEESDFVQTAMECHGKRFRNGEVAFLRIALIKILEKELGFTSGEKLINDFYDKGYLRHMNGKKTFSTYFNGKTISMIRFNAGVISTAEDSEFDTSTEQSG